jgi:hypothetical protein
MSTFITVWFVACNTWRIVSSRGSGSCAGLGLYLKRRKYCTQYIMAMLAFTCKRRCSLLGLAKSISRQLIAMLCTVIWMQESEEGRQIGQIGQRLGRWAVESSWFRECTKPLIWTLRPKSSRAGSDVSDHLRGMVEAVDDDVDVRAHVLGALLQQLHVSKVVDDKAVEHLPGALLHRDLPLVVRQALHQASILCQNRTNVCSRLSSMTPDFLHKDCRRAIGFPQLKETISQISRDKL